jgi:aryl sulfotransferase
VRAPLKARVDGIGFIWIASYPKSGNTWMRLVLATLTNGGREVELDRMQGASSSANDRWSLERDLHICLADMTPAEISALRPLAYRSRVGLAPRRIFLKVHDHFGPAASGEPLFPPEVTLGCLHIVRDPRDVCVSLAAHSTISIDEAIERMGKSWRTSLSGAKTQTSEDWGSWSTHAVSWLEAPVWRKTLRYEDMIADPLGSFAAVADFCMLDVAPSAIAEAVALNDFSRLAVKEAKTGFRERPANMERFFRAGSAGQWREQLSLDQIRRIESTHGAVMRQMGYEPSLPD